MTERNIPLDEAGPTVADVMLSSPRTYAASTALDEVRAEFENPRVRLLLVTDGDRYVGSVTREHMEAVDGAAGTIADVADAKVPALAPGDTPARAVELYEETGSNRLPVIDGDGSLLGLVCWNRSHGWFCA